MAFIRASFKSAVSRGNSYNSYNFYSCEEGEMEGEGPGVRAGLVNEGYQIQVGEVFKLRRSLTISLSGLYFCTLQIMVSPRMTKVKVEQ